MRTFIALDFNTFKSYFQSLQKQIDEKYADITFTNSFHITLNFLGEVPEHKIADIKAALQGVAFKPFSMEIDQIGVFPNDNYIRVIWVGLKEGKEIIALQNRVEGALKDFGFKKEFDFHPHITLGRVKYIKDKEKFRENLRNINAEKKVLEVKEFKLMKSTLTSSGPFYEELALFKA